MRPSREQVDRAAVQKGGLGTFVRLGWSLVEPKALLWNWHLTALCEFLEQAGPGDHVINIPPGTGKSLIVSVFWPAWTWTFDPGHKWIAASYDPNLAARDADRMLDLVQSDWYRARWGDLVPGAKPATRDFDNTAGGWRFSTSIKGGLTGRHGDSAIIDDPIKPIEAVGYSSKTRRALDFVNNWESNTLETRRAEPSKFRKVNVMQRLHDTDLAGHMLDRPGTRSLVLPMEYDPEISTEQDIRKTKGELLFPARFDAATVRKMRRTMGPAVASAQLQQNPAPDDDAIIPVPSIRFYHPDGPDGPMDPFGKPCVSEPHPDLGETLQFWDCTFKDVKSSDFVAGTVWRKIGPEAFYLQDLVNKRLSFVATVHAILDMLKRYPGTTTVGIEAAANGHAVLNIMERSIHCLEAIKPIGSKEARASAASGPISFGEVYFPHPDLAPWVGDTKDASTLLGQLKRFPYAPHDDMVDSVTHAILYMADLSGWWERALADD